MKNEFRFSKNDRSWSEPAFWFMRHTLIPATKLLFRPRIVNRHNMPLTGPCFIYGNHSNYFDPFMINVDMQNEPTAGVMTRDQFHKTIPRIFMDSIGIVPTSKYVPEPSIVRSVLKMIDQKRMIVIFPEGGRRWDGRPKPLIETTLKLFWKMRIPVHPVQIHGSYLAWPRWADHLRRGSVEMRYLDPIHVSDFCDYETFAKHCRSLIHFDEYDPPDGALPVSCSKPASGIQRLLYRCPVTGVNGAVFTPDGEHVFSREAAFRYRMNVGSRLVDSDGYELSVIDLFDKINQLPLEYEDPGERILLQHTGSQIYSIDSEHRLIKLDKGIVELTPDQVTLRVGRERIVISLEEIRVISVEQNHKLSVTTAEKTVQFTLEGKSALQWQITLNRLRDGETPVTRLG